MTFVKHMYALAVALIAIILLSSSLATAGGQVSYTITVLSLESDLNSVALFKGGVIAVGKSGTIGVAYANGEKLLEKPVDAELLGVSCVGSKCLAVGVRGVAVLVDVSRKTFKPTKISDDDLKNVEAYGGRFYISTSRQIIAYSPESGVSTIFNVGSRGRSTSG
jgi:hypothetical protein